MSRAIVEALRVTLTPTEERTLTAPPVRSGYAYDVYLRARHDIWGFTKEGIERARESLEQALSVVGDNVLLLKGLGLAWWMYVNAGHTADAGHLDKAEAYARRILRLEPASAHGSSLLGLIAIDAQYTHVMAQAYAMLGRANDALRWLERSFERGTIRRLPYPRSASERCAGW